MPPPRKVCAPGCQALVDELYVQCDGVTTPDGLYFDPDNSIEGKWSDQVRRYSWVVGCRISKVLGYIHIDTEYIIAISMLSYIISYCFFLFFDIYLKVSRFRWSYFCYAQMCDGVRSRTRLTGPTTTLTNPIEGEWSGQVRAGKKDRARRTFIVFFFQRKVFFRSGIL